MDTVNEPTLCYSLLSLGCACVSLNVNKDFIIITLIISLS